LFPEPIGSGSFLSEVTGTIQKVWVGTGNGENEDTRIWEIRQRKQEKERDRKTGDIRFSGIYLLLWNEWQERILPVQGENEQEEVQKQGKGNERVDKET